MNKKNLSVLTFIIFLGVLSCGGSSSSDDFFFTSAKQTTPVITATVATSIEINTTWEVGHVMYEIFNAMQDYTPIVNDPGGSGTTIGLDNIYKVLYQTGSFYSEGKSKCTTVTEKAVGSPFDFGNTDTYNCTVNDTSGKHGTAIKEDATTGTKKAILSWHVNNNNDELGVIQGTYNSTTGDVDIDIATYVHYTGQNDFSLRTKITGNEKTHAFTLKIMKDTAGGGYVITFVGQGVSKGAGNHFLFKASDSNGVGGYYCFSADAAEADLKTIGDVGSPSVPTACAAYGDAVTAMTPFGQSDLPLATTDFNKGNANQGDIYLFGI